jgi:hypothetical protein
MKAIRSMIAALGLALVLPAQVDAATTDPEVIIYRFPGGGSGNRNVGAGIGCDNGPGGHHLSLSRRER